MPLADQRDVAAGENGAKGGVTGRRKISRPVFWVVAIVVVILTGGTVVVWMAATELMSPARRALQEYHRDWLEKPLEHGMSIQRFAAMEGKVPCLVVVPDLSAGVSKRGEKVRRQLEAQGVALRPFGETFASLVLLHGRNGRKEDLLPGGTGL